MVHELLLGARLRLDECDAIAFGAGPGAFTGLRIACGIAQGLAYGARKPVIPIGNLQALAFAASRNGAAAVRRILAAIDARMQEIYWAVYSIDAGTARKSQRRRWLRLPAICPRLAAGRGRSGGRKCPAGLCRASSELGLARRRLKPAPAPPLSPTLALADCAAGRTLLRGEGRADLCSRSRCTDDRRAARRGGARMTAGRR